MRKKFHVRLQVTFNLLIGLYLAIFPALALTRSGSESKRPSVIQSVAQNAIAPNVVVVKFKNDPDRIGQKSPIPVAQMNILLPDQQILKIEPLIKNSSSPRPVPSLASLQRIYFIHYVGSETPISVAQRLNGYSDVEYAEPKRIHYLEQDPNDPEYSMQSFYRVIQASQAWDLVKGEQGDVTIAIVDGGTEINHPDLMANLWINPGEVPGNRIDDDKNGYIDDIYGWNFANDSNDPTGLSQTPINANHGTHTAGIACAVTNNGEGVAGVSWNARLMAINASSTGSDNAVLFGYEGIVYAAENGADIISCSWGSQGSASVFEQEVITYAMELGSVVVAAAGNNNNSAPHFPSSYQNVFSVTATNNGDQKISFSNYGPTVDVSAPGLGIRSTLTNGKYGENSGTSMAAPLVAGIIALVKTRHPDWTCIQSAEQVRVTADNIDGKNPAYAGLLGFGRINAFRAVTESSPSIRIAGVSFTETNGDGIIQPGETVNAIVTLINYLVPAVNLRLSLSSEDDLITISRNEDQIGSIGTLERVATRPFEFIVDPNTPSGHPIKFTLEISAAAYQDRDRFSLTVLPTFGDVNINNIAATVTNIGRIGFLNPDNPVNGLGFRYKNGTSLLFEGALIAGIGVTQISNAARAERTGNNLVFNQDFAVGKNGDLQISTPGAISDQESRGIFNDRAADLPMNILITQETFAFREPPNADYILFRYTVENQNTHPINNFHLGFLFDWDIDGGSFNTNKTSYDSLRRLGYAYDTGNGPDTFVGMSVLSGLKVSYRAIYNDQNNPGNPSWGLYDGFTDDEKWQSISGGVTFKEAGPADISFVIATGPYPIPANSSIQLGFALLAGASLTELQTHADAAQALWDSKFVSGIPAENPPKAPLEFALDQNYPNPFNPGTSIRYQIPKSGSVVVEIYNSLGQPIRTLVKSEQIAGVHSVRWDGRDNAGNPMPVGIYWCRLRAGELTETRKMLLLR